MELFMEEKPMGWVRLGRKKLWIRGYLGEALSEALWARRLSVVMSFLELIQQTMPIFLPLADQRAQPFLRKYDQGHGKENT